MLTEARPRVLPRGWKSATSADMRYTLRLLAAQQLQRATALVAACELLRCEGIDAGDLLWGEEPVRIGLWVGSSVTRSNFDEALRQLEDVISPLVRPRVAIGRTKGLTPASPPPHMTYRRIGRRHPAGQGGGHESGHIADSSPPSASCPDSQRQPVDL